MRRLVLPIAPKPKPRMTAADRWKRRPVVLDYWTWCEDVRALWAALRFPPFPEAGASIHFRVPMPVSWSKRKRAAMAGEPHRQTPDLDNMLKALLDALHVEDKAIYHLSGLTKTWSSNEGFIVILLDDDDATP